MTDKLVCALRRTFIVGGCAMLAAPPALAHRSQSVLTTVNWNATTSMIEVVHRMHAHDAEVGLAMASGSATDVDLTLVKSQARLAVYIESHFSLTAPDGRLVLEVLGAEMENEAILVYQEARAKTPPLELVIDNRILRDVFDGQTNLVNIRMAKRTRTMIFSGNDGAKPARDLT